MPIVFYTGTDPVAAGLVASLNRPGTNLTGSALLSVELMPKRLQLLRELIPGAVLFGLLGNSVDLQAAARTLGLQLVVENPGNDCKLETAFATFSQKRAHGVLAPNGPSSTRAWTNSRRWRPAMRCRRSTHTVSLPSPAA
jgi:putative ABC transport system substrate-binding protein